MSELGDLVANKLISDRKGKLRGREIVFLCVAHDEENPSASWNVEKEVWKCFSCSASGGYVDLSKRLGVELPKVESENGLTLSRYADCKKIPEASLKSFGVNEIVFYERPALHISYKNELQVEQSVRYRFSMNDKKNKFRWRKGDSPLMYGMWRLKDYTSKYCFLVEGESDCHTLWYHGIQALGLPGVDMWDEEEMAPTMRAFDCVYLFMEPDQGGKTLVESISKSCFASKVRVVVPSGYKDPSALHLESSESFKNRLRQDVAKAHPIVFKKKNSEIQISDVSYRVRLEIEGQENVPFNLPPVVEVAMDVFPGSQIIKHEEVW